MIKRPGFRFSLLTLLLVLTLAAVSVSHWRTNRELAKAELILKVAREEARTKQQTIRQLNDELGRLTVDDESQVYVISQKAGVIEPYPRRYHVPWQSSFAWCAYLPSETDWQVCWNGGEIPLNGGLRPKLGQHVLRQPPADGRVTLMISHLSPWDSGLALVFRCADDIWSAVIPRVTLAEFRADDEIHTEIAGSVRGGTQTESFPPTDAVVLLRQWRDNSDQQTATRPGIVVWLEPIAKKPAVPLGGE